MIKSNSIDNTPRPSPALSLQVKNRISQIDIIRGFIILLVFAGNVEIFSGVTIPVTRLDYFVTLFIHTFIDASIYGVFAFLFGVGFTLSKVSNWNRRMMILFIIGCVHGALINQADILTVYAIFGMVLYFMRDFWNRGLIYAAIALLCIPAAYNLSTYLAGIEQTRAGAIYDVRFSQGILAIFQARFEQWIFGYFPGQLIVNLPNILGAMMLGLAAGKIGFNRWNMRLFMKLGFIGLPLMLAYAVIYTFIEQGAIIGLANGLATIGAPCLGFFYVAWIVRLCSRFDLSGFATVGRMSLTLYVMSSLIGCVFYPLLYGKISVFNQVYVIIIVYAIQWHFAAYWMQNHEQGILESIWRKLARKKAP